MKKKIFIIVATFFIFTLGYFVLQNIFDIEENDQICEVDSDCKSIILECGPCSDYTLSVNKRFAEKYFEISDKKCIGRARTCDAVPRGKSTCKNKKCVIEEGYESE